MTDSGADYALYFDVASDAGFRCHFLFASVLNLLLIHLCGLVQHPPLLFNILLVKQFFLLFLFCLVVCFSCQEFIDWIYLFILTLFMIGKLHALDSGRYLPQERKNRILS